MKLLFSEARPDYEHYIFPYSIWALREADEKPSDIFNAGFLPSSRELDRFYLCRQIRINLAKFQPSSENRRVLRKGEGLRLELAPRAQFEFTPARREFCRHYTDAKFGAGGGMSHERLDSLFNTPVTSHVLVFTDEKTGVEAGVATLYVEEPALAFYYYSFYDLNHPNRGLGMFMMTSAAAAFAARGIRHLYLGTCYSESALYKTQFPGVEFFNGFRWSEDLEELKYQLRRGLGTPEQHLLEAPEYRDRFYGGDLARVAAASALEVKLKPAGK
jgi:hypothetical protein